MICLVIGNSVLSQDNPVPAGDRFKEADDQIAKHVVDNHIPGGGIYMFFSPETKTGVITFQNNNNGDLFGVFRKLYHTAEE